MFKVMLNKYRCSLAAIPEDVGDIIAIVMYIAFMTGLTVAVVGFGESNNYMMSTGAGLSGIICALIYSA